VFITSRLDYCNSLLYGLPKYQLSKLQRVMNDSARLVYCSPNSYNITPLLRELHWLPVCSRIKNKLILLLTFKVLHSMASDHLSALFSLRSASVLLSYHLPAIFTFLHNKIMKVNVHRPAFWNRICS